MKKDRVILYANQYGALKRLTNEEMGILFHQIFRWLNGEETEAGDWSSALFLAFEFLTLQMSIDNEKYLQKKGRVLEWKKKRAEKNITDVNNSSRARVDIDIDKDKDIDRDKDIDKDMDTDIFSLSMNSQSKNAREDEEQEKQKKDEKAIENFVEYWNQAIEQSGSAMRKVKLITETRREKLLKIVRTIPGEDAARAIHRAMNSPFCNGATKTRSRPVDFDWLIEYQNFTRLLEGSL
ncbi:MAG: hypothetical protein IKW98_06700 [Prevotella sp.]|nr:hypothetical protein [Prevotella sp.]